MASSLKQTIDERKVPSDATFWIDTNWRGPVVNSQPPGVGRLASFGETIAVNNLGRNIELSTYSHRQLIPLSLFEQTLFPDCDEPSQFDLDMHAFLVDREKGLLFAPNHDGLVRVLPIAGASVPRADRQKLEAQSFLRLPGDIERWVLLDDCFITTSPAGYHVSDPAQPGLIISEPWTATSVHKIHPLGHRERTLSYFVSLADWGMTSALFLLASGRSIVVAAGNRLGLFYVQMDKHGGIRSLDQLWEANLPFHVRWVDERSPEGEVVVAGPDYSGNDAAPLEWESLTGGGFAVLDASSGTVARTFGFAERPAWGNGAVPLAAYGPWLVGADSHAGIHAWSTTNGSHRTMSASGARPQTSLGMAHMALAGGRLLCGFNRAGYRLLVVEREALACLTGQ